MTIPSKEGVEEEKMLVGELKKALQEVPDELEVVTDCFEKDGVTLSTIFRVRIEDIDIEETTNLHPALCPEFAGKQVLSLKFIKKRSF